MIDAATSTANGTSTHSHNPMEAGLMVAASVVTGLFAGFFLTYSMSIQLGLARVDDVTYVATFQAINATIRNPVFAVVFFGCVPLIGAALVAARGGSRRSTLLLAAGLAACLAVVAITFLGNVPLNDGLATYHNAGPGIAAGARAEFEDTWNRLNAARSVLSVAGAALVVTATATRRSAPETV